MHKFTHNNFARLLQHLPQKIVRKIRKLEEQRKKETNSKACHILMKHKFTIHISKISVHKLYSSKCHEASSIYKYADSGI